MKTIEDPIEFFEAGREIIKKLKDTVLTDVAEEAVKRIKEKSLGQFEPVVRRSENSVAIGVLLTDTDPTGHQAAVVEAKTQAFAETFRELDESLVKNLLIE